ncbi:MAG: hypothetical protein QM749_12935 [Aquabacterium sp.]
MVKVLKVGALWLAIAVVVWLITVWRWQSTGHAATTGDIVGQLFVLPLLLTGVFVLALWRVERLRVQAAAPVAASPAKAVPSAAAQMPMAQGDQASDDTRALSAWVLAEAVEAPLHQMLSVIAGLVPDADDELDVPGKVSHGAAAPSMKAHLSGVAPPVSTAASLAQAARAPQLTARVLLPAHWPKADRHAAIDWLRSQCGSLLDWADAARAHGVCWSTEPLAHPEGLWDELDRCMVGWSRQARPELWLVLAVDSAIDADSVDRMQAAGELFTATHQTGKVPGEGAVALLLANAHWPDLAKAASAPIQVWRPVRTRRDKSADAAGRVGTQALSQAIGHAVSQCQGTKDSLLVVADADHRASRTAELFESLQDVVPGLDPMLAVTRLGEACGELGMARALAPSALACTALRATGEPGQVAVAAHVQSSHDRVLVALAPWAPAAAAA